MENLDNDLIQKGRGFGYVCRTGVRSVLVSESL